MKWTAIFTGWFDRLIKALFPNYLFDRALADDYLAAAHSAVYIKQSSQQADAMRQAIQEWLFGSSPVAIDLINRTLGVSFYRPTGSVILAGTESEPTLPGDVNRRGLVEVVVDPLGVFIALYDAYEDGDRKTDQRYRVYVSGMNQRHVYRYMTHGALSPGFQHVSHHDSEYSYYRKSPLATWHIPANRLPSSVLLLLPADK